jgi:hypothetical protein
MSVGQLIESVLKSYPSKRWMNLWTTYWTTLEPVASYGFAGIAEKIGTAHFES